MANKKPNYFMRGLSLLFIISMLAVFLYFFMNVSIGGHIAKENYIVNGVLDKDAWLWNIGIFVAIMFGWYEAFNVFQKFYAEKWEIKKKKRRKKHE